MIRKTVAAACKFLILLLAAYAFFFVVLGRRTAYGHLCAILATPQAQEAAEDMGAASQEMKKKVVDAMK